MRGGKTKTGYTITEVLIVLAISSAMFIAANALISGRVAETSFRTGANEMTSRIQDVIDQVSNGQYNDRPLTCTESSGNLTIATGGSGQGSNKQCSYIGKFFTFTAVNNAYSVDSLAYKASDENLSSYQSGAVKRITDFKIDQKISGGLKTTNPSTPPLDWNLEFGFVLNPNTQGSNSDKVWLVNSNYAKINTAYFCLIGGSRTAKIKIGDSITSGNLVVKTDFINTTGC